MKAFSSQFTRSRLTQSVRSLLCVGFLCGSLMANASTNYGVFVGSTVVYSNVSEVSGTDPGQTFFKAPSISGDTLDFNPVFTANASSGNLRIRDAQLNFDIVAKPGFGIEGLVFSEAGDFTLAGNGTAGTLADVSASFFIDIFEVDNVAINTLTYSLSMTFAPNANGTFTLTGDGGPPLASGNWSGSVTIDFDDALANAGYNFKLGATRVGVALDNTLTAISEPNTQAFIAKKDAKGLSITVVPEPATGALVVLGIAGVLALGKRRFLPI